MSEVLKLQDDQPATPDEEKASKVSVWVCRNSYYSVFACVN